MFSEEDLSGGDKVCTAVPYIYIYVCVWVCFLKQKKLKIWPCLIEFYLMIFSMQCQVFIMINHQVLLIKLISFSLILKVHSHYLMLTHNLFLERKIYTIEGKFLILYKKLSILLFQLYKTLPLEVRNQKHPAPFFYGTLYCWFLKTNNQQKLYKTKCMIRKFQPIMNMQEIKSLTKNL